MYTVADVIHATGAKRRTVQFWADRGVIRATGEMHGGQGVHRSFSRHELIIACIIHPLSLGRTGEQTRSVAGLTDLAQSIRIYLKHDFTRADLEKAIAGSGRFYLVVTWLFKRKIRVWVTEIPAKGLLFPGIMTELEMHQGRCEVLYLNEWLRPLRNM